MFKLLAAHVFGIDIKKLNHEDIGACRALISSEFETQSKKISNDQELIQSDPISCPQNQKGNN